MRRRDLLGLAGAAIAWPLAARAQQKAMPVIGLLGSSASNPLWLDALSRGLAAEGFVEGKNLAIEPRWAEGHYDRLPAMAAALVGRPVAVITALALPAAQAAKAATATIPIVFYCGVDPAEIGLVASLAHPGGNMTGVSAFIVRLNPKRVQLLRELLPGATAFGLIVNPRRRSPAQQQVEATTAAARTFGLRVVVANAGVGAELEPAFASLAGKVDGVILGADPFFGGYFAEIAALAAQYRLPTIYNNRETVDAGGLISYGNSFIDTVRQLGVYTGTVLKGAKPADLPVQQPTKFELVINMRAAKALGLTVPQPLFALADEVIE